MLPFSVSSYTDEKINEKRIGIAMRMIGHEFLKCLGDNETRVMPIEKVDERYKISFEIEFGFNPDDVVSIIERLITKTSIANHYFVEVEQCTTKEIVYGFEVGNTSLIPCDGRMLPKDCYRFLITILDDTRTKGNLLTSATDHTSINIDSSSEKLSLNFFSKTKKVNPFLVAFLIITLLTLIGFITYFIKKKNALDTNPNLILIGTSQFDKKNRTLSFGNKSIELSNKETELLSLLRTAVNVPIERELILQSVWGDEGDYVGRTLDVYISKLRKKLEADASVKIVNIRGIGYKLVMDVPK